MHNNIHSIEWPAWEIKYEDLCEKPYMYAANPEIKIRDNGAVLCSFEITRTAGKSKFTQIVSLGSESRYISVYNETDWREEASLLKAEFAFTAKNEYANYDIGLGYTKRGTNTKKLCEVPAQKWADITDESGDFGVSVFSDSRTGWDKPDDSTLRLTLIHTPMANYRWECSQHVMDMGINRYSFAVMGHSGNPDGITAYADEFCQPMHTFITEKHNGTLGKEYSFVKLSNDKVRITAVKKAQESDRIILRVAECSGSDTNGVEASFSKPIVKAFEIRGDETELREIPVVDGKIRFDIKHNGLGSFALVFDKTAVKSDAEIISLKHNAVGITSDNNRHETTLKGGISVPREILPEKLLFSGIEYAFSDQKTNCLICDGGEIDIGSGFKSVHLLLTSLRGDKTVMFNGSFAVNVPDCFEALGHWDLMRAKETGYIKPVPQAFAATHTHGKNANLTAKQFYIFHAEIPLDGKTKISLPDDEDIVIFAATAVKTDRPFIKGDTHFDTLAKRNFDYEFSDFAIKHMYPNKAERILDKFLDRNVAINIITGEFYNKYSFSDLYFIFHQAIDRPILNKKNAKKLIESRKNIYKGENVK